MGPSLLGKYDYVTINADWQFVKENIKEAHNKSEQLILRIVRHLNFLLKLSPLPRELYSTVCSISTPRIY